MVRIPERSRAAWSANKSNNGKRKKRVEPVAPASQKSSFSLYLTILIVAMLGILVVVAMNRKSTPQPKIEATALSLGNSFLEAQVLTVAAKFRCSCGTCGGTPLENRSCESAAAERQFIREKLKAGLELKKVIAEVKNAYGWLKPEIFQRRGTSLVCHCCRLIIGNPYRYTLKLSGGSG